MNDYATAATYLMELVLKSDTSGRALRSLKTIMDKAETLETINAELLAACEMAVKELADLRPPNVKAMNMNGCQNPHVADKLKAAIANAQQQGEK